MAERTGGVRRWLGHPALYSWLQQLLGADGVRRHLVETYLKPVETERILDLGCGPGDLLKALPARVGYVGVDLSPAYIEAARHRFGARGRFELIDARKVSEALGRFDAAVCVGLLHHLDDPGVLEMLQQVGGLLSPGGRFVSLDPGQAEGQPRTARWLMRSDRGAHVRPARAYEQLVGACFEEVRLAVHHDLARLPYTHVVVEGRRPRRGAQINSE